MSKHFDFKQLRVLNTRPESLAKTTSDRIHSAGGIAVELPLIKIQPTDTCWINKLPTCDNIQHVIFISPNAVTCFFSALPNHKHTPFKHIPSYALGQGTQKALKQHAIFDSRLPTHPDSEHLLMLDNLQSIQAQHILLIKGQGGRTRIQETLIHRGAYITAIDVYQRILPQYKPSDIQSLWHEDAVDIILITSETALHHLFSLFEGEATSWLCRKPCLVMSERLAKAAYQCGFQTVITDSTGI